MDKLRKTNTFKASRQKLIAKVNSPGFAPSRQERNARSDLSLRF